MLTCLLRIGPFYELKPHNVLLKRLHEVHLHRVPQISNYQSQLAGPSLILTVPSVCPCISSTYAFESIATSYAGEVLA